ncbi:MAG: DNA primase [Abitibacteriaceae bacterium]|nr:DNA primase [Abditibacteriaceae bacterium]MBV9865997.1 DNA primase [Abditibacteriaceae bacterium]
MDQSTEEIREKADIVDIVSQYVALRPAGPNRWKACCPFHDEKTPSFNVSRDKGYYHCFGCKASGDVFKFLMQVENIPFPEAKKQLADRYGVVLRPNKELTPAQQAAYSERDRLLKVMAAAVAFFREQLAGNGGLAARDYARSRGLSQGTLDRFGIGYAPDSWESLHHHLVNKYGFKVEDTVAAGMLIERNDDGRSRVYDRYRHRLMFPIWDQQGRVIAFGGRALEGGNTGTPEAKYINSPEGTLFKKSQVLYGWHIARSEVGRRESVIVTEGYMDTIALHEAGFANAVATLGTALTVQHALALRRLSPKVVYLCYDGDSAGMQAALRAGPMFAANELEVQVVTLSGGDDPDTYIRKHGDVGFENALREARPLAQYRLEMAIAPFDLSNLVQRTEAVRAAAEIIAGVASESERNGYIDWLADRWGLAEGSNDPTRISLAQTAIRREVEGVGKRHAPSAPPKNIWQQRQQAAEAEKVQTSQTISETMAAGASGVAKAERLLLCSLLGSPSWRARILNDLPPEQWTQELHGEVAIALRQFSDNEPINPAELVERLSPEAGALVSELVLSDEAQTPIDDLVVQDCIQRVRNHWNRQREREMLDMIRLKLERGEEISEEERATYLNNLKSALVSTKRMSNPQNDLSTGH